MLVNARFLRLLPVEHFNHAGVSRAWPSMNEGHSISISTGAIGWRRTRHFQIAILTRRPLCNIYLLPTIIDDDNNNNYYYYHYHYYCYYYYYYFCSDDEDDDDDDDNNE